STLLVYAIEMATRLSSSTALIAFKTGKPTLWAKP
ncbi:uncharacterized protein METZ01_LOCUS232465, partial [marine metagenome]